MRPEPVRNAPRRTVYGSIDTVISVLVEVVLHRVHCPYTVLEGATQYILTVD